MGVIINEFEVVAEPETRPAPNAGAEPSPLPAAPSAFEPVVRQLVERALRVWAD